MTNRQKASSNASKQLNGLKAAVLRSYQECYGAHAPQRIPNEDPRRSITNIEGAYNPDHETEYENIKRKR